MSDEEMNGFFEMLNKTAGERDVPPMHPEDRVTTFIPDEELIQKMPAVSLAKAKFKAEFGVFRLMVEEERRELEEKMSNCFDKGWILAWEDRHWTKTGEIVVAAKFLVPQAKKKDKKNKKEEEK